MLVIEFVVGLKKTKRIKVIQSSVKNAKEQFKTVRFQIGIQLGEGLS